MPLIPVWMNSFVQGVGHYFTNIAGALFGGALHNTAGKTAETLGERAGERILKNLSPDSEDIMKALINFECQAILDLLRDMTLGNGVLEVNKVLYRKTWVIAKLLEIEERNRQSVFILLNIVCEKDRGEFLAYLNIIDNKGVQEMAILLWRAVKGLIADPRCADFLDERGRKLLIPARRSVKMRLRKKGVKKWLD